MRIFIKYYKYLLIIICFCFLAPFVYASFFSRPCADDFTYSLLVHEAVLNGGSFFTIIKVAFKTVYEFYFNWQGTYTSAFFMSLQPGVFGEKYYFIGPIVLLSFSYLSIKSFFESIVKKYKLESDQFLLSFITLIMSYVCMPFICDGLYWYNGSWHYILHFYLTILNISFVIKHSYNDNNKYLILSCFVSLLISGGNVVTGFVNILLLLITTILSFVYKTKRNISISLLFAIAGYIVMYISPGTLYRQSLLHKDSFLETIFEAIIYSRDFICQYANFSFICIIFLSIIFGILNMDKIKVNKMINPMLVVTISYAVFASTLCAPLYSTGSRGEDRVINVQWLVFIYLVVFNIIYIVLWLYNNGYIANNSKFSKSIICKMSIMLLFISAYFSVGSNSLKIVYEIINGNIYKFAEQFDERMELMNISTKEEIVYVEPLVDSICLKFDDINENENDWRTIAWEDYYGIRTRLK